MRRSNSEPTVGSLVRHPSVTVICFALVAAARILHAGNPIIENRGVNDPHIHIFDGKAYLYATHDRSADNTGFFMDDWWIWSSEDLVSWQLESVLTPQETYIGKPFSGCWATDAAHRNGKYYWYFSEQNHQTGAVVGPSPTGPWEDPLGKPLLPSDLTPTHEYDIAVFRGDDGQHYAVFGVWDFYIARLNDDMISLAEQPRKVEISNPEGPYGIGTTDDKPFLHSYNGRYYLSWGCFYAMSDDLYGPYTYVGSIVDASSFAEGYDAPTWPNGFRQGRHGSFFEWNKQWYFAYCDISQTGNRYFRDTFISYVHYREEGEMAIIRVDGIGVGEYDAAQPRIEAEDYFRANGVRKNQIGDNDFAVRSEREGGSIEFPNVRNLDAVSRISVRAGCSHEEGGVLELRESNEEGRPLSTVTIPHTGEDGSYRIFEVEVGTLSGVENICWVFRDEGRVQIDWFSFS